MNKLIRHLITLALPLLAAASALRGADLIPGQVSATARASSLTTAEVKFLVGYEAVRLALVDDNLVAAQTAAATLIDSKPAASLVKAPSLNGARMAFKKLSVGAVRLVQGQVGYYVVNCSMVDSDWVQITQKIGNPYMGKHHAACGQIRQ